MKKLFLCYAALVVVACGPDWQNVPCNTCKNAPPPVVIVETPDSGTPDSGVCTTPDAGHVCVPDCSKASCGMDDGCGGSCYPVCQNGYLKDHESCEAHHYTSQCQNTICLGECERMCRTNYPNECHEFDDCVKCCGENVL